MRMLRLSSVLGARLYSTLAILEQCAGAASFRPFAKSLVWKKPNGAFVGTTATVAGWQTFTSRGLGFSARGGSESTSRLHHRGPTPARRAGAGATTLRNLRRVPNAVARSP